MNARLMIGSVAIAAIVSAADVQPSRLRYAPPTNWERSIDPDTQVVSLSPPARGASVTFAKSVEFPGTAEQWQEELWLELLKEMKLAVKPMPGVQAGFLTRMGVFIRPDGSHPWICQYSLVKDGRGEMVLFYAENEKHFFEHLATVNHMIHGITVEKPTGPAIASRERQTAAADGLSSNIAPSSSNLQPQTMTPPTLEYTMSPDFPVRQGGTFVAKGVDGNIQVYDFRAYRGNFEEEFRRNLFRDWIAADLREEKLFGAPTVQTTTMAGAEKVCMARFRQDFWGTPRERLRVAILASGAVAIVDINIRDADAWQRYQPGISAFLNSLKIGAPEPAAPPSAAGGQDVAGLWLANKSQFQPNLLGGVGSGSFQMGTEFYLLSEGGRVYRGRKLPKAPGGDLQRFDYNAAQRDDPQNSGSYIVRGNQVIIRLGPPPGETITANRMGRDVLSIYDIPFKRDVRE
jgi:hypothetical protein